ncbi:MAG: tRNA (guanosine(37)-N1)-methyltransferase TrmD [Clostridiales bacterium]|nr:tRNA (guanosine(37)-N1)-methyltransferase TrmD [Clostridiales bacterium]
MRFEVLTIFPEMFDVLNIGIIGRAVKEGKFELNISNIRDYSKDKHRKTDDAPFGGGAGMVMTPQPIVDAIRAVDPEHKLKRIYLSPKGVTFNQRLVKELSKEENGILLLCGSYEGIDERVIQLEIDMELSIGDFVLTGGELPAMCVINAVARYIEGVLGSNESTEEESFSDGMLEYPHYTRPQVFEGLEVPEVLLSGNHAEIRKWRRMMSENITKERRPDLLKNN